MGDDFTSHQVFAGDADPIGFRTRVIARLRDLLTEDGYTEVNDSGAADRSIAVGPAAGRWVCLYDSYGNGDDARPEEFHRLSAHLSMLAPVVDILMDDSAAVHFYLYRDGQR